MDLRDLKPRNSGAAFDSPTVEGIPYDAVTVDAAAAAPARAASPRSSNLLQPGALLGARYEILELLGQGGMGVVYKARDRELDRLVALKIIRPDLAGDPHLLQRFKHELILARQVTHKNVIRIFDLGEADGVKFISMEYVEGESLAVLLRARGKFPSQEAAAILSQIFRALEAAHAENVIHRDLKPQNVMCNSHGKVVVMDFGLAHSSNVSGVTRSGALVGTLEYMAPEQAQGGAVDVRSDIYSAGLIFYELLTGKGAFDAESAIASLLKRSRERAVPPIQLDSSIPRPLSDIVVKCLELHPDRRYQTVQQVLRDLAAWQGVSLGDSSVAAAHVSTVTRTWPRRIGVATGAAALLLIIAAIALRNVVFRPAAPHKPVTLLVADFRNQTSDAVFDGTLEPAFTVAMEGAGFISTFRRDQARKIGAQLKPGSTALDESLARLVAVREGLDTVVAGSIDRREGNYRVSVKALDGITGKALTATEAEASGKDGVLQLVGKLAARVRKALGDTTADSAELAAAETFTANSIEAAHEYGVAQELAQSGKNDEAIAAYLRALRLDPNLGRAYAGLAVIYNNTGRIQEAKDYYKLALARIDRMSEREKFRTRSAYYLVMREPEKAMEELTQWVERFPSDSSGLANLALAYFYRRDMSRALEQGRRAVAIYPNNVPQRNNVGLYAMYAGDFDTAIKEQQKVLQLNPSFALAYVGKALSELGAGRNEDAARTYQELEKLGGRNASTAATGMADLALYEGSEQKAAGILEKAIAADLANKDKDLAANQLTTLAYAYLLSGKKAQALAATEKALSASQEDSVLFWAARLYLALDREPKAISLAQQLGTHLENDPQAYAKLIQGEALLKHGKAADALKLFQDARKTSDTWLGRLDLARAYLELNAFTEAYSELEVCLKRRGEATAAFLDEVPTYRLFPAVYYYMGRAQEGLRSPAAADSYRTFLQIKQKSEGDPLVADARRRISNN